MSRITRFEDLDCWKQARIVVSSMYAVSNQGEMAKDFGTRDQLRRAALSIMNNIAEGFSRTSAKEFIRFLSISESSAAEVKSMLYVLSDLKYIDSIKSESLHLEIDEVRMQLRSFIKYLNDYNKK